MISGTFIFFAKNFSNCTKVYNFRKAPFLHFRANLISINKLSYPHTLGIHSKIGKHFLTSFGGFLFRGVIPHVGTKKGLAHAVYTNKKKTSAPATNVVCVAL